VAVSNGKTCLEKKAQIGVIWAVVSVFVLPSYCSTAVEILVEVDDGDLLS